MLKVLIADQAESFTSALAELLYENFQVQICRDGKTALELLECFAPDVLVMDLFLAELDGISLLRIAGKRKLLSQVLVVSSIFSDFIEDSIQDLQIGYLVRKPCDATVTAQLVQEMARRRSDQMQRWDLNSETASVLLWLGLDVSRDGYSYLCAAIAYRMEHPRHLLTKEVYPAVAKCFNCSGGQVEKSISRVIEAAWKCRDDAIWREFFPTEPGGTPKRPTNDKFIARMAVFLESRRLGRLENAAEHRQVPEKIGNYVDITNEK